MVIKKNQDFVKPADLVSNACFEYMARVMELRNFLSLFFTTYKVCKSMVREEDYAGPKDAVGLFQYNYKDYHEQFVGELTLSRTVESFNLYLQKILVEIFTSRPEMLCSEGKIEISKVLEITDKSDLINYIAEKKINELSYKSLDDIAKYIESITGEKLFKDKQHKRIAILAHEIRNLIAHNDCVINERFLSRLKGMPDEVEARQDGKLLISDDLMRTVCYALDNTIFRFDELMLAKFSLHKKAHAEECFSNHRLMK